MAFTYCSKALTPLLVTLQVVFGMLFLKCFSTSMYPAFFSLLICVLRFPLLAPVFSSRKLKSEDSTLTSKDMMAKRNWECSKGSKSLNIFQPKTLVNYFDFLVCVRG